MALRGGLRVLRRAAVNTGPDAFSRSLRCSVAAAGRSRPLGPMPNQHFEGTDMENTEKYRSYTRYVTAAEAADHRDVWWRTYRKYREEERNQPLEPVDIGLPHQRLSRMTEARERRKLMRENKKNPELEKDARLRNLRVPLDRVKAEWEKTNGPHHIRRLAEHYHIYTDLFHMAYFIPRVMLRVSYGDLAQVHYGNVLSPNQAAQAPCVQFDSEEGNLWTLLLTSPDEHLVEGEQEVLHWLVGNIPGSAVSSGEELCHYISPFPARGTGFQRFVYVLFKQGAAIDFSAEQRPSPCFCLEQRTFSTLEFYRKHQHVMTPAGLAFFQAQWDESVTHVFHTLLNMREPVFQYIRPPVYHPPQKKYPHRQPLRYLDRYRDGAPQTYGIY